MLTEFVFARCDGKSLLPAGHDYDDRLIASRLGQILVEPILHLRFVIKQDPFAVVRRPYASR